MRFTTAGHSDSARLGFTLTELMVAVAVLAGLMTLVGVAFTTASKATGKATSLTKIQRESRQVTDVILEDLAAMSPSQDGNAVLAITGGLVQAKLTSESDVSDPDQTGPRRTDILMLITDRKAQPFMANQQLLNTPTDQGGYGENFQPAQVSQVVYGHANVGDVDLNGDFDLSTVQFIEGNNGNANYGWDAGSASYVEPGQNSVSDMPASEWHLARRSIGFPVQSFTQDLSGEPLGVGVGPPPDGSGDPPPLTYPEFLNGRWDVYGAPVSELVSPPNPDLWPGFFEFTGTSQIDYFYFEWLTADITVRWPDPNGEHQCFDTVGGESHWFTYVGGSGNTAWEHNLVSSGVTLNPDPINTPPFLVQASNPGFDLLRPANLYYTGWDGRTLIDLDPPAGLSGFMGPHFLDGCISFQVEYTYDDPREIQVQVDPGTSVEYFDENLDNQPDPMPIRWYSVEPGRTRVWSRLPTQPDRYKHANPAVERMKRRTDPHRWPRAVRITMEISDEAGQLEKPVTRTLIYAWD
jgi:prepilin-type N-terminal cleavage/methylation domain-containing protein